MADEKNGSSYNPPESLEDKIKALQTASCRADSLPKYKGKKRGRR